MKPSVTFSFAPKHRDGTKAGATDPAATVARNPRRDNGKVLNGSDMNVIPKESG
jgi:hypothetical protein